VRRAKAHTVRKPGRARGPRRMPRHLAHSGSAVVLSKTTDLAVDGSRSGRRSNKASSGYARGCAEVCQQEMNRNPDPGSFRWTVALWRNLPEMEGIQWNKFGAIVLSSSCQFRVGGDGGPLRKPDT
jgi:hypothetical protein